MKPLTTGQVARELGVSPVTVFRAVKAGRIKATTTPGGHFRIPRDYRENDGGPGFPVKTDLNAMFRAMKEAQKILLDIHHKRPVSEDRLLKVFRHYPTDEMIDGIRNSL